MKRLFSPPPTKDKSRERFYLLPGQSGRAYRRKQRAILKYSIIVGLLVSGLFVLAILLYYKLSPG